MICKSKFGFGHEKIKKMTVDAVKFQDDPHLLVVKVGETVTQNYP